MENKIPLNFEASEGDTNKEATPTLPEPVVQCLENARFLHLATCHDNIPHVSLMSYTYFPSTQYSPWPVIIMTTNRSSKKTTSILANPNVSILVHDWVSHRQPGHGRRMSGGSPAPPPPSSLHAVLANLNTAELSSISATIGGSASIAPSGSDEEKFFLDKHLENHAYEEGNPVLGIDSTRNQTSQSGAFIDRGGVSVIIVKIKDVRISDYQGKVKDWALIPAEVNGTNGA